MSSLWYIGTTLSAVAQVDRFTPANVEVGDIFTLTRTGEDGSTAVISFTATGTTVANVTAGLTAAWNASVHPLISPLTASDAVTSMTLTADTAGIPFAVAPSHTDGGGAATETLTRAAVTANRGANDYGTAENWSTQAVPIASDNVVIDGRQAADILYGLNQSGVALTSFKRYATIFAVGQASAPLRIQSAAIDLNIPPTDGSSPTPAITNIDAGSVTAATVNVWGGNTTGSSGRAATAIKANHASAVANIYAGVVDVCNTNPGDTGQFGTANVYGSRTRVTLGPGLATLNMLKLRDGATVVARCALGAADVGPGCTFTSDGGVAMTTLTTDGWTIINSTGTIATLEAESNADVDTTQTSRTRTVTDTRIYGNAKLKTDLGTTYTNGIDCLRGAKSSQVDAGDNVTVGLTAT